MPEQAQIDLSVFFYTYSTIAQTLAGAFGFMIAAVLYRMAAHATIEVRLIETYMKIGRNAGGKDGGGDGQFFLDKFIRPFYDEREGVKRSLIDSLHWTAGTIIACLVLIPAQPALWWLSRETSHRMKLLSPANQWLLWLPVIAVLWIAIYTITTYFPLVKGVAKLALPQQADLPGDAAPKDE